MQLQAPAAGHDDPPRSNEDLNRSTEGRRLQNPNCVRPRCRIDDFDAHHACGQFMDSIRALPQIHGGSPARENDATPLQASASLSRTPIVAQAASALPVKLLGVALLTEVFVDAPVSYSYFRLL